MFINSNDQLKQFYQECQKDKKIAVDTEFYWTKTYKPELCLIQIANTNRTIIIDPIKNDCDLKLVKKLLLDKAILKVFHSARQDLEIFYNLFQIIPQKIFDTQIAVIPLGYDISTSLKKITWDFVNVNLEKDEQRYDWRIRPLSKKQIKYAINDVKHLLLIHIKIKESLRKLKREKWINELHKKLIDKKNYSKKHLYVWEKIRFEPKNFNELFLLKKISSYREIRAMELNRTPKKIITNNALVNLCKQSISLDKKKDLLNELNDELLKQRISLLLKKIKLNTNIKAHNLDAQDNQLQREAIKKATFLINEKASELNIHPSLIASKKEIKELVISEKNIRFSLWKKQILGKKFFKEISVDN